MTGAELRARVTMTPAEQKRALGRLTGDPKAKTEAQVQREIVNALDIAGYEVWPIGQYDARRTQRPGVPDLYAMRNGEWRPVGRLGGTIRQRAVAAWIEVKAVDGRQSAAQKHFQAMCDATDQRYILARSVDDIRELL